MTRLLQSFLSIGWEDILPGEPVQPGGEGLGRGVLRKSERYRRFSARPGAATGLPGAGASGIKLHPFSPT